MQSTSSSLRQALGKAEIEKLKAIGTGIKVGRVLGDRVLVKTIEPYTEMDDVEKRGLLIVPEKIKEANTPIPSTGIIVMTGEVCNELFEGEMVMFSKYAGTDFTIEREGFRILETKEVMAVLVDTENVVVPVKGAGG